MGGQHAFDPSSDLAVSGGALSQDPSKFKFPSLDPETERFLWRRKADLDLALRLLDKSEDTDNGSGSAQQLRAKESTSVSKSTASFHGEKLNSSSAKLKPFSGAISLNTFIAGASAAQKTQIQMITHIFGIMDADRDGQLSVSDVKAYFRAIGKNGSDLAARKWIRERDLDQDGVVSQVEFVASYAHILDPASKSTGAGKGSAADEQTNLIISPVAIAFGLLRLGGSVPEAALACNAATEYVQRILDNPRTPSFWRIVLDEKEYDHRIGRLFGGHKIMLALGFVFEDNSNVLALRDEVNILRVCDTHTHVSIISIFLSLLS